MKKKNKNRKKQNRNKAAMLSTVMINENANSEHKSRVERGGGGTSDAADGISPTSAAN